MNHENGAALYEALTPGARVTVRRRDGGQSTGRAELRPSGWYARTGPLFSERITATNIIRVQS